METNTELECCKALIWLFSVLTSESSAFELVCLFGKKGNTSQSTIQHIYIKKNTSREGRRSPLYFIKRKQTGFRSRKKPPKLWLHQQGGFLLCSTQDSSPGWVAPLLDALPLSYKLICTS